MWTPDFDIIVETLTGSEFEVSVRETDTIGYLKYRIRKYEGIPVSQQHILFNQNELKDAIVLKDIPLVRGSRLTLVLGMRGGPISARRAVSDNWYDLSEVLNGTNRGQLTPIEPLSITTTGVKVLLYKDCKKNINRLMKLRKHHLHSHGAAGSSTSSSMTGNSIKCSPLSASSAGPSSSTSSARTQLKFLDPKGDESMNGAAGGEAQDQQWLMDNITTLKKMKQLRRSLDAKKKKKRRQGPGDASDSVDEPVLGQGLRQLQVDLEMNDKLQKWLHRVASNATHLSDAQLLPPISSSSPVAATSSSPANAHSFERMRRRPILPMGSVGPASPHVPTRSHDNVNYHLPRGGARKKESAFQMSITDYCLAKSYELAERQVALVNSGNPVGATAEERLAQLEAATVAIVEEDAERRRLEDAELLKKRRESSQFEERLLTQFYDNSSPQCENFFRAFATTSAAEGASVLKEEGGGGGATATASGGEFKWGARNVAGNGNGGSGQEARGGGGGGGPVGIRSSSSDADLFLNSLLLKRNQSSKIEKFTSPFNGGGGAYEYRDYFGGRRWSDRVEQVVTPQPPPPPTTTTTTQSSARNEVVHRELAQEWENVLKECEKGGEDCASIGAEGGKNEVESVKVLETVIIEKADRETGEEELLEAACNDIMNDPEAFEDDHLDQVHDNRFELIDLMKFEESESGADLSMLKNAGYLELAEGDDDDEESTIAAAAAGALVDDEETDDEECHGSVLIYEDDGDDGEAEFIHQEQKREERGCSSGIRRVTSKGDRAVFPSFWPNFDKDDDDEEEALERAPQAVGDEALGGGDESDNYEDGRSEDEGLGGDDDEEEEDNEDDDGLDCDDNDALEFDDFAYFPSTTFRNSFRRQSASLKPYANRDSTEMMGKGFLPRLGTEAVRGEDGDSPKYRTHSPLDQIGGERLMGPSLPEIINRGTERSRRERARCENSPFGGRVDLEEEEEQQQVEGARKRNQNSLPDIKLLESELKMMGLDVILNDSDDSFERTIKRHFRNESRQATASSPGECLLRSGNEQLKKKSKDVEDTSDWLIQLDVELENPLLVKKAVEQQNPGRCAKCNKKLGIIMIMKCHCGLYFCSQHRYAEAHNCTYDFKENGKRLLAKENPLVVGEKLPKI